MPFQEDSGFDSEDKQSNTNEDATMPSSMSKKTTMAADGTAAKITTKTDASALSHMADLEVVFRGSAGPVIGDVSGTKPTVGAAGAATASASTSTAGGGDSDDSNSASTHQSAGAPPNTCRILQRKLELKVERAKRNYSQYQQQENIRKSQCANLIPISRLPIPGDAEQKPLVDYKSDSSDEPEELSFFPAKLKNPQHQRKTELSDTFSIQEMTIESDLDSEDSGSQNLELLPPLRKTSFLENVKICFGCSNRRS